MIMICSYHNIWS